ncbi:hypothetical protein F5Y02DRAFT_400532 [Annulohypoxylon stygium]|nr:hypothetical protein F5Y02DRAFT_400532 [Annulohypoxylon stygium]
MESSSQLRNCDIVFVLGPPGSGKGTICRAVVNSRTKIGNIFYHLSVGDYLRELTSPNGPYHNIGSGRATIRKHILDNKLVPAGLLIPVLCSEIHIRQGAGVDGITVAWLIDGFPRNMETALAFEERVSFSRPVIPSSK